MIAQKRLFLFLTNFDLHVIVPVDIDHLPFPALPLQHDAALVDAGVVHVGLDGVLDEGVWQRAEATGEFTQRQPEKPSTQPPISP